MMMSSQCWLEESHSSDSCLRLAQSMSLVVGLEYRPSWRALSSAGVGGDVQSIRNR